MIVDAYSFTMAVSHISSTSYSLDFCPPFPYIPSLFKLTRAIRVTRFSIYIFPGSLAIFMLLSNKNKVEVLMFKIQAWNSVHILQPVFDKKLQQLLEIRTILIVYIVGFILPMFTIICWSRTVTTPTNSREHWQNISHNIHDYDSPNLAITTTVENTCWKYKHGPHSDLCTRTCYCEIYFVNVHNYLLEEFHHENTSTVLPYICTHTRACSKLKRIV